MGIYVLEQARPVDTIEDVMALPLRPCTACKRLQWAEREYERGDGSVRTYRARVCGTYQKFGHKPDPQRVCRCIHFRSKW